MDFQATGSGGLGAVSFGISESLLVLMGLALLLLMVLAAGKLVKIAWAMFSGG